MDQDFDPGRRRALSTLVAAAGLPAIGRAALPEPEGSEIDHVVVVMMENRSFDHVLGWVPGADGRQRGLSFADADGQPRQSFALAADPAYGFQGCGWNDPDHGYDSGRTHVAEGAMDGFLKTQPAGDLFPIGYYRRRDVPFFAGCADHWTVCDRYHTGILASTLPNRIYMHAGQTDRRSNTFDISRLPTVWDRMIERGLPCRYYYADLPVLALWGPRFFRSQPISRPLAEFVADFTGSGAMPPALAYIDPYMLGEGRGTSWDDHPFADIRNGQAFLNWIYTVLSASAAWPRTLLVVNYDEWGGFFDHVEPPFAPVTAEEYAATGNDGRLGLRVPCLAIGPRVRRGHVEHSVFDCNSILNFLAWRFGFDPLGARAASTSFAAALDFDNPPRTDAPVLDVPAGPFMLEPPFTPPRPGRGSGAFGGACRPGSAEAERKAAQHIDELRRLQSMARAYGAQV